MKRAVLFLILFFIVLVSYSQTKVSGTVKDSENGEPLPGVNVYSPEKTSGTVTDKEGGFEFKCMAQGKLKLKFSLVGYENKIQVIPLKKDDVKLNVKLKKAVVHTQEVVVSAGIISTQHENAVKVEVIPQKTLSSGFGTTLPEKLKTIPGLDMISKGNGVTKPVLRGLSQNNLLMLNNGVRMENFQFSENHPYLINEFGAGKTEIIKGPASLLYGSDAIAGIINVLKEKPAPAGKIRGDFHQQYHSASNGWVSNLGVKGSSEDLFWGVRGGFKSHQDYRDGDGNYVPNTRFNEYNVSLMAGLVKDFGTFKIFYDHINPKLGMPVNPAVGQISERARNNDIWYQDLDYHLISSKNTLFLGDNKIEADLAWQTNNRRLFADDNTPQKRMVDMVMNTLTYNLKWHLPSKSANEWILGVQGMDKQNTNQDAPNHVIPDARVHTLGGYFFGSRALGEKITLQAGGRYDWQNIDTEAEILANNAVAKPALDRYYQSLSGSVGLTYQITGDLFMRSNLASGYRVPSIAELTENGLHGARFEQGNPELEPMRNYELDLSTHWHSEKFMLELAGFYNSVDQFIYLQKTGDTISGAPAYAYRQDDAELYGGEAKMSWKLSKIFTANVSYASVRGLLSDERNLPFIPQNKIRMNLDFQKKMESRFVKNISAMIRYTYAFQQDWPGRFEMPTESYQLLDISFKSRVYVGSQTFEAGVNISNLLDETYIDHLSTLKGIDENMLDSGQGKFNPGRNIMIFVNIPFESNL